MAYDANPPEANVASPDMPIDTTIAGDLSAGGFSAREEALGKFLTKLWTLYYPTSFPSKQEAIMKRLKTEYPGVFYREADRIGCKGREQIYYIVFKKGGKVYEGKAGRQYVDDMTPSKPAVIRAGRIEGRRESKKEIREREKATKLEEAGKWTLKKLWEEYAKQKTESKSLDTFRYVP